MAKIKLLAITSILVFTFAFVLPCAAAQVVEVVDNGVQLSVNLNGSPVDFDQPPYISASNRTMVPIRFIAEKFGAQVNWDSINNAVTIMGDKVVVLNIGSAKATIDGADYNLDTSAVVTGGRTMVPLRFVGEALGAEVKYTRIESPQSELINSLPGIQEVHITGVRWINDSSIPSWVVTGLNSNNYIILTTQEWTKLDDFSSNAGEKFSLKSVAGGPLVDATIIRSFSKGDGSLQGYILNIDPQQYKWGMTAGVGFNIIPAVPNNKYKWSIPTGITVIKPLDRPEDDLKQVHINGVLWHGDNRIDSWTNSFGFDFLITVEEPAVNFPTEEPVRDMLGRFIYKAGSKFVLKAQGYPDINIQASGTTDDGKKTFKALIVNMDAQEKSKMVPGVSYTLHSVNNNPEYRWIIRDGVSITG